jgi:hypothetical protein
MASVAAQTQRLSPTLFLASLGLGPALVVIVFLELECFSYFCAFSESIGYSRQISFTLRDRS